MELRAPWSTTTTLLSSSKAASVPPPLQVHCSKCLSSNSEVTLVLPTSSGYHGDLPVLIYRAFCYATSTGKVSLKTCFTEPVVLILKVHKLPEPDLAPGGVGPQPTSPPSCVENQNTNTEWGRWKMLVGVNTFGGRRSECFQLHFSEQIDRVCQQIAGLSQQVAEAARPHCQQSAHGWCHQITFRISGFMFFPAHNAAPLKVPSSA